MTETTAKKVTLYVQTPDGKTHTRKTDRTYTHATAWMDDKNVWHVSHYCGSLALAQKQLSPNSKLFPVTAAKPAPIAEINAAVVKQAVNEILERPVMPARAIKIMGDGIAYARVILFVNGQAVRNLKYKKIIARNYVSNLTKNHGFAVFEDAAKLISPVSTYNP